MEQPNPGERWAPIPGYEGHYEASDLGRIRSLDRLRPYPGRAPRRVRGRILKATPFGPQGCYLRVALWMDGTGRTVAVHLLVLLTFAGPCPEDMECCHGNGDGFDNRLVNLRWDTHAANMEEQRRHRAERGATCPQGHLLAEPNLTKPNGRGYRDCLACHRARNYCQYRKRTDRPFDFRAEADEYYRRIMAGDTGNRVKTCMRGHRLEHPNLAVAQAAKGRRSCLACNRARNNRHDARRAGQPFDLQAVSDQHYERIMAGAEAA